MPLNRFLCELTHEPVTPTACVACAGAVEPPRGERCQFTPAILRAIADANDPDRRSGVTVSVTMLTGCLRKAYLQATQPYDAHPHTLWAATHGTLVHTALGQLNRRDPNTITEARLRRTDFGVEWSGQVDEFRPERRLLLDYKTVLQPPSEVRDEHVWQLNLYRYLLTHAGTEWWATDPPGWAPCPVVAVEQLGLVYLSHRGITKIAVPVFPDHDVEEFLEHRLGLMARAYAGDDPSAVPAEYNPYADVICRDYCPFTAWCRGIEDAADATPRSA